METSEHVTGEGLGSLSAHGRVTQHPESFGSRPSAHFAF